ncbi:META domain-containing protein [Caenimonas sp. S4]|nr:META domain-containing protein [Caenimonas soli]
MLLASFAWAGCAAAWAGTLEGTAAYRERVALPPDAVFEAVLQDVSKADAPAELLGRTEIDPAGQLPFRFQIAYDDAAVRPGRRYVVRATVRHQGQVLFTTDRAYPVLQGAANAPLTLRLVSTGRRPSQPALSEARPALTGMFAYMADAATISLCADAQRLPVAMELDYKALEAAYLKERTQPGQELLVSLEGEIAPRASMEPNQPPRLSLVVERFINVWPRESCGNPQVESPLRGTYWKLVRLGETPVRVAEKQPEPHLILANLDLRISGSGGCNGLRGSFELDGDKLRFRGVASTRMACLAGMEQEQRFLKSMEKAQRYRISGSHLDMLDAAGTAIARFEAVALR